MGYHTRKIAKGVLGELSKVREELEEAEDALLQGNKILLLCELADVFGALRAVAHSNGVTLHDLQNMADATARAFRDGER